MTDILEVIFVITMVILFVCVTFYLSILALVGTIEYGYEETDWKIFKRLYTWVKGGEYEDIQM